MKVSKIEATLINHMGDDLSIVNSARVSFDKESEWEDEEYIPFQRLSEKDSKLINYLAKHEHNSPFNHCFLSFRVKAPIFVARQLVKHKFMPWNEVSRRYVDSAPEFYIPEGWRKKAENVKQGSGKELVTWDYFHPGWYTPEELTEECLTTYKNLLHSGVCPEQARMVLPQNTMTEWIWSGSLGAFADMCKLRLGSGTQKETREVAQLISNQIEPLFPVGWKALMEK